MWTGADVPWASNLSFQAPYVSSPNYKKNPLEGAVKIAGSSHTEHGGHDPHGDSFAAKRMRKIGQRRAVDYTSTVVRYMHIRMFQRDSRDRTVLQPNPAAAIDMLPSVAYLDNPSTSFVTNLYIHH